MQLISFNSYLFTVQAVQGPQDTIGCQGCSLPGDTRWPHHPLPRPSGARPRYRSGWHCHRQDHRLHQVRFGYVDKWFLCLFGWFEDRKTVTLKLRGSNTKPIAIFDTTVSDLCIPAISVTFTCNYIYNNNKLSLNVNLILFSICIYRQPLHDHRR